MHLLLKHKLLAGAIALVAAASAGGAYAATQTGTNPRQAFLNDVAKRLNVTPSQLRAAVRGAMLDRLEAAIKAGMLTRAQANQIKQRLEQGGPLPFGPFGLGRGGPLPFGPFGPGRPGEVRPIAPGHFARHGMLSAAARYLGLSDDQLLSDLRGGRTLAQVAQSRGRSVSGLQQAMVAAVTTRLNRAAADGFITKAQEQRLLNRLRARMGDLVNRARLGAPGVAGPPAIAVPAPGPFGAPPPGA